METKIKTSQEELKCRSQEIAKLHTDWQKNLDNLHTKQDIVISKTATSIQERQKSNKLQRNSLIKRLWSFFKK